MLAQLENVKRVAIHLFKLFLSLWCQVEHLGQHNLCQLRTKFRKNCLRILCFAIKKHAVMFEALLLALCELRIPSFHCGLHVYSASSLTISFLVMAVMMNIG